MALGIWGTGYQADCKKAWPVLKRSEIEAHGNEQSGVWIVVGNSVYDVTNFVPQHPGGKEKILQAAGSQVESFWNIYRQHYTENITILLRKYKIGEIDSSEWPKSEEPQLDPYATDPPRSPRLIFHSVTPCNAEPPPESVAESWITPNELFFVRNHSPVPNLSEENFKLVVAGREGQEDRTFTLDQLKSGFRKIEQVAAIQCGGNRRHGLNSVVGRPMCFGTEWDLGAMSNAKWTGISLREVLDFCGLNRSYIDKNGLEHVVFKGADGVTASIPMQKATCPGDCVLLAYEMNDQPLPRDHGYPLRVVVPGHVGIRNIKWVEHIKCSKEEAEGPWQRGLAYKGFNPSTTSTEGIDIEKLTSLQEMPVQSAIVFPQEGQEVEVRDGKCKVRGYAWSGGGRGVIRVDVSADMGHTWQVANLREGHDQPLDKAWAWTLWDVEVPVPTTGNGARVEFRCRATDASFNVQPDSSKSVWNLRGIVNNAVHRVTAKTNTKK